MQTETALTSCESSSVKGGGQQQAPKSSTSFKQTISLKFKPKSIDINQLNEPTKIDTQRKQRTTSSPKRRPQKDIGDGKNQTISQTKKVDQSRQQTINHWHYKQTGIKSRPIKLIKHPIEHIERKIILSYLLGFLFKLIAISTGPLIVLVAYLFTLPFIAIRRSIWFLLNLNFLTDLRIKTRELSPDELSKIDNCCCSSEETQCHHEEAHEKTVNLKKQLFWKYCPLNFIETYWFKERLVNNVILVVDNNDGGDEFLIVKLRHLVKENILSKPSYRKFLSLVIARGLPFYKSYYWRYLGLVQENVDALSQMSKSGLYSKFNETSVDDSNNDNSASHNLENINAREQQPLVTSGSNTTIDSNRSVAQFSVTSSDTSTSSTNAPSPEKNCGQNVEIPIPSNLIEVNLDKVFLDNHIYLDENLHKSKVTCSSIRRYTHNLLNVSLSLTRPLWEIRVIPASNGRTYLIFRCHQCLADGRSLTNILTDHLTNPPVFESSQGPNMKSIGDLNIPSHSNFNRLPDTTASTTISTTMMTQESNQKEQQDTIDGEEEDESELKPIKAKRSFISRVSKANSIRSAVFVGPLTVLLWVIWTFTRRKNNHLNKCLPVKYRKLSNIEFSSTEGSQIDCFDQRRFYMTHYSLTKFYQIKQMTRSTVSDVILCALSGALRDYLRKFNGVSNPPNLNASLTVDMRQPGFNNDKTDNRDEKGFEQSSPPSTSKQATRTTSLMTNELSSPVCSEEFSSSINKRSYLRNEPEVNCTLVNVPLATSIEGTVPRLWEIRGTMDELRTSADPWVMLGLQQFLFAILPSTWYQRVINYIALRNSSTFVSNINGPVNMVESWCVDLLQRALFEAQQSSQMQKYQLNPINDTGGSEEKSVERPLELRGSKLRRNKASRIKFLNNLGSIAAIYYCMQPPTSDIPISFNCITYHNKLYVTSLSRSLLVEDSKLLIRLFFKQLNQLATTIAKRRSSVTIIRTPIPIEISCQPASPGVDDKPSASIDFAQVECNDISISDDDDQEEAREKATPSKSHSSHIFGFHKDDIEANVGTSGRTNRCSTCNQTVCTCQRRKSLFSFDHSKQRAFNLVNLLHPSNLKALRTNNICENFEKQDLSSTTTNECICGRKLLEELDEEDNGSQNSEIEDKDFSSAGSQTPSEPYSKTRRISSSRPCCAKCRAISERSTLSLNTAPEKHKKHRSNLTQHIRSYTISSSNRSDPSIDDTKEEANTSAQLILLDGDGDGTNTKLHSKSETDLRPMNKDGGGLTQRDSKESWFQLGRRGHRKISLFPRSYSSNQQNPSPSGQSSTLINSSESIENTVPSKAFFMENPVELLYKHLGSAKRRRQSLATGTATTQIQRAVVVKDEVCKLCSSKLNHALETYTN